MMIGRKVTKSRAPQPKVHDAVINFTLMWRHTVSGRASLDATRVDSTPNNKDRALPGRPVFMMKSKVSIRRPFKNLSGTCMVMMM
jgi:hypothetical protein